MTHIACAFVLPSACSKWTTAGWISIKLHMRNFHKKLKNHFDFNEERHHRGML
jgi:hypothetical protein